MGSLSNYLKVPTVVRNQGAEVKELGILRNYDGDVNGNVKKAIGLMSKTTTLHVHHAFFVHFFAVLAQLRREMVKF